MLLSKLHEGESQEGEQLLVRPMVELAPLSTLDSSPWSVSLDHIEEEEEKPKEDDGSELPSLSSWKEENHNCHTPRAG